MEKNGFIDRVFEKEIGMGMNAAIKTLVDAGITPEEMGNIANGFKKSITDEIEKRNVPYEYRFLLLNVILFTILNNSVLFHKTLVNSSKREKGSDRSNWIYDYLKSIYKNG